jgi:DNA-binding CsgD family transcriptional regulator
MPATAGRLNECGVAAQASYEEALTQGSQDTTAIGASLLGLAELCRGSVSRSMRWLREAAALFRGPSGNNLLSTALAWMAHAAALGGELDIAATALQDAEATRSAGLAFLDPQLGLARVWVAAAMGELSAAQASAAQVADEAEASGQLAVAVMALHDLARVGSPKMAAPRLAALAPMVEGPFAPVCETHANALAARDAPRLDRAAESFEAMGAKLLAAEAAAEAAAAYRAEGKKGRMLAAAASARRLLEDCEGARTPALSGLAQDPLTPREREVAMLAARGLTSAEIARRLTLSVRTVENHLQRGYAKLGVANRDGLRRVLQPETGHS